MIPQGGGTRPGPVSAGRDRCIRSVHARGAALSKTTTANVTITNRLGLHARPAMLFVETASKFCADITVCRCDDTETIDGKSIMQMMMLAACRWRY